MKPNPYASPVASSPAVDKPASALLTSAGAVFGRHTAAIIGLLALFLFVVAPFEAVFARATWSLPAPTLLAIQLSRLALQYWYLALLALPIYFCFLVAVKAADQRVAGVAAVWSILFWIGEALLLALLLAGLALPFFLPGGGQFLGPR